MMRTGKNYNKMMRRGIKNSISRFLAITCIVALGTGFLCGLLSTEPDMKKGADDYFDKYNAMDYLIQGTSGITKDDVAAIQDEDYVEKATGKYVKDMLIEDSNDENYVTRVIGEDFSDKDSISSLDLLEGRMPEKEGECVIELPNMYAYNVDVGENLNIYKENENYKDCVDSLSGNSDYKVVGVVRSPQFISMYGDSSQVGDGSMVMAMYVDENDFNLDYYTACYVTLKGAKALQTYGDEYNSLLKDKTKDLTALGKSQSIIRDEEIKEAALKEYNKAKEEFETKKAETYAKIEQGEVTISQSQTEIDAGKAQVATARQTLSDQKAQLETQKNTLRSNSNNILQLKRGLSLGMTYPPSVMAKINEYDKGVAAVNAGTAQIKSAEAQLDSKEQELIKGQETLDQSKAQLEASKVTADTEFAKAETKLNESKAKIDNLAKSKWIIQDRNDNLGVSSYDDDTQKVGAIAKIFPVFFFIIAALVALTTLTRMVEEERGRIGTLKSLGYDNPSIAKYYIRYGLFASVIGCAIGIPFGCVFFPKVIANAYSMMYVLPKIGTPILWYVTIPVCLGLILMILIATLASCRGMLKEKPATLTMPKGPKPGKRILLEHISFLWNPLKFSYKVTLRNIFRYKKRFLMTIIGVAGCFSLLLAGFGIRDSIGDICNLQYSEIMHYDYTAQLEDDTDVEKTKSLKKLLNNEDEVSNWTTLNETTVTLSANGEKKDATLVTPKYPEEMTKYTTFRERISGDEIEFKEGSVILTEKAAEELNVSEGDSISVKTDSGETKKVKITGITENYMGVRLYAYDNILDEPLDYSVLFVKEAKGADGEAVAKELLQANNVTYIINTSTIKANFQDSVKSIDYIVYVLIICSGALAIIVLYNLVNVNFCERRKGLATIRVLGFNNKEVRSYIFREVNILSVIGIVVGIPIGIWLHHFIVRTVEVADVMFGRSIYLKSYFIAAGLTIIFTLFVNLLMRKNVRNIDMVESMKAND